MRLLVHHVIRHSVLGVKEGMGSQWWLGVSACGSKGSGGVGVGLAEKRRGALGSFWWLSGCQQIRRGCARLSHKAQVDLEKLEKHKRIGQIVSGSMPYRPC